MNKIKIIGIIISAAVITCMVIYVYFLSPPRFASEAEIHTLIDSKLSEAVKTRKIDPCETLPSQALYTDHGPRGDWETGYKTAIPPRAICLEGYARQTLDITACDDLKGIPVNQLSSASCKMYIAEADYNAAICSNSADLNDYKGGCLAMVYRDTKYCFNEIADKYDTSKYPRSVASCIVEVVRRTGRYKDCLQISGSDFGDQWAYYRNDCLVEAVRKDQSQRKAACAFISSESFDSNQKSNCENANFGQDLRNDIPPENSIWEN